MSIGILNEGHLHRSLKELYVQPGDQTEAVVDGYVVDILRDDLIIEVQTASFSKIARKMRALVPRHAVRLVYPVPRDLWIIKQPREEGDVATRRRSPKRRDFLDVFAELVSFSELIAHPNFQLDVVVTAEEVEWEHQPGKRWRRRGWVTVARRLLMVHETIALHTIDDYLCALPAALPHEFLTSDLARVLGRPRPLAQKVAYCLRTGGLIERVGSQGNSMLYAKVRKPRRRKQKKAVTA